MLAIFSLDGDLRDEVTKIKARSRLELFSISLSFLVRANKSLISFDSFAHAQSSFLIGVERQICRLVVLRVRAHFRLGLDVVTRACVHRFLLLLGSGHASVCGGLCNVLCGHLLCCSLSLHLLAQKRNVLDALQLTRVAQKSGKKLTI